MTNVASTKVRAVVLCSGNGSNFEAIARNVQKGSLPLELLAMICDQPGAKAIERARNLGVPTVVLPKKKEESRANYDLQLNAEIKRLKPDLLVLAGFMRLLAPSTLALCKIINIHPSLLPEFPGKDAYLQAYDAGVKATGITVHWVDEGIDTGPIIAQRRFEIGDCTSVEEVQARGIAIEQEFYSEVLAQVVHYWNEVNQGDTRVRTH